MLLNLALLTVLSCLLHSAVSLSSNLASCLEQAHVPSVSASSANYVNETNIYNIRVQYKPAAIAIPTNTSQISSALLCAAAANITVQAKGGGHSYAGFSSGGKDGGLTISLESFQEVTMSPKGYASDVAKIGAGQRLGNMALALYNTAKVGLSHGSCPGVGIGGHATHGGFGLNSRAWGLTVEAIVAMEAVLPNGTVVTVSASSHQDLWFALRGAADSFAIITNFYMKTQPVPKDLTYFQYRFGNVFGDATKPRSPKVPTAMFLHLQEFANNASVVDGRITFNNYIDTGTWSITGLFHGTATEFKTKIVPELLRTLPVPAQTTVSSVSWTESLKLLASPYPVAESAGPAYDLHDMFFAKSLTVPSTGLLTEKALNAFFNYANENGIATDANTADGFWSWYAIFDLWGGAGSATNNLPDAGSATHSGITFWTFQLYGYVSQDIGTNGEGVWPTDFPTEVKPFIQGLHDSITSAQPETAFGAYYNYVDDSLTPAEAHRRYFGDKTYSKLLPLKKQVDPGMLITNPLGVGM